MKIIFDKSSYLCAKCVTQLYSTSFSIGIHLFDKKIQNSIYAIYGFVRYMDEIVDTFHDQDQEQLFENFEADYRVSYQQQLSLNPILHCFVQVVHRYELSDLVNSFIKSMKLDLYKKNYNTTEEYEAYIYGSANVIGLMCLKVFVDGDQKMYLNLKGKAERLGSAFQKVNFLRDIKTDIYQLGRYYFPNIKKDDRFTETMKKEIIQDIESDLSEGFSGIKKLPQNAKLGVYIAYQYYRTLLSKFKRKKASEIINRRFRVSNAQKICILISSYVKYKLKFI